MKTFICLTCGRINQFDIANRPDPTCRFCDTAHSCVKLNHGDRISIETKPARFYARLAVKNKP